MDSFNRFSEKKLPNKENFYSILKVNTYLIRNMYSQLKYGIHLNLRVWENTMTCI